MRRRGEVRRGAERCGEVRRGAERCGEVLLVRVVWPGCAKPRFDVCGARSPRMKGWASLLTRARTLRSEIVCWLGVGLGVGLRLGL